METSSTKVPPTEILNIKNFEHIILWMLKNNESCQWSDFVNNPVNISGSTLSGHLKNLMGNKYIDKIDQTVAGKRRKVYIITPEGGRRYHEISTYQSEEVKLNYPPSVILNRRNYDHWILWMVYNNTSCKWSDFLAPPLSINQSSLSKNLNQLMSDELNWVSKHEEEKTYSITQAGRKAYSQMLRKYDLDRQSILEEESKRIEEIVGKIRNFFGNKPLSEDIQFRFVSNVLKLDYSKIKEILPNENDFKIILYLCINHPSEFPNYIPLSKFAREYKIEERILNYYIPEIVENDLYPIKFFVLNVDGGKVYYFRSEDEFERNLRTIVDDCITKLTYLNKLYKSTSNYIPESEFYDEIIDTIINRAKISLIPEELTKSLKEFLPSYISHLLYKFDTETEIKNSIDKFDALAYDTLSHIFQALKPVSAFEGTEDESNNYYVDPNIFKFLKPVKSNWGLKLGIKDYLNGMAKVELLDLVDSAVKLNRRDIELKQLKAIVFCFLRRYHQAINYLHEELDIEPIEETVEKDKEYEFITNKFILAYAYIGIGRYNEAGEIRSELYKLYESEMLTGLLDAFIYAYNIIYQFDPDISTEEDFHEQMSNLIMKEQDKETKADLYEFYSFILHLTEKNKEALEKLDLALGLNPNIDYLFSKTHYLVDSGLINDAIDILKKIGRDYPEKGEITKFKIASLYYKTDKVSESKELLEEIIKNNPQEFNYLNSLIYVLAHLNLKDEAINRAESLIEGDPNNGNYFDSYGEILMMFGDYEDAITKFKKALEIEPEGWFVYETYIKLGRCLMKLGYNEEAIENFKRGKSYIKRNLPCCKKHFTWIEKADTYLKQLNAN